MPDLAGQIRGRLEGWAPPDPWLKQFADAEPRTPDELAALAEELSAAIKAGAFAGPVVVLPPTPKFYPGFEQMRAAILAVLDLHTPTGQKMYPGGFDICSECGSGEPHEYPTRWPCPTLRAAAKALGIEVDGG